MTGSRTAGRAAFAHDSLEDAGDFEMRIDTGADAPQIAVAVERRYELLQIAERHTFSMPGTVAPIAQVLLVEDDAAIRTAPTRALREQGHSVTAIGAGLPALSAAVETKPDVVLLDLGLPDVEPGIGAGVESPDRGLVTNAGWDRWTPVNAAAIAAHLAASIGQLNTNKSRLAAQSGVGTMAIVKTAVTAAALGVTAYSRALGKKVSAHTDVSRR